MESYDKHSHMCLRGFEPNHRNKTVLCADYCKNSCQEIAYKEHLEACCSPAEIDADTFAYVGFGYFFKKASMVPDLKLPLFFF